MDSCTHPATANQHVSLRLFIQRPQQTIFRCSRDNKHPRPFPHVLESLDIFVICSKFGSPTLRPQPLIRGCPDHPHKAHSHPKTPGLSSPGTAVLPPLTLLVRTGKWNNSKKSTTRDRFATSNGRRDPAEPDRVAADLPTRDQQHEQCSRRWQFGLGR